MINSQELFNKIKKIPIISRFEKSAEYPSNDERYAFFLYERPDENSAIEAVKEVLEILGYEELYENIIHFARSIQSINGTKKLPLLGMGFNLNKHNIKRLKVYYILSIIESESEDAMSKVDNKTNVEVMQYLLSELDLAEKASEVNSLIEYMDRNGNEMHIVGLNIEKDKPLSLKIYFRMKQHND